MFKPVPGEGDSRGGKTTSPIRVPPAAMAVAPTFPAIGDARARARATGV